MRWFVRGDVDGFFGLALDNLVQLLLIENLCRVVLGFSPDVEHFNTHAYATSKAAIIGLTKSMAAYYAEHKVRVNAIAPGLVRTPMSKRAQGDEQILQYMKSKQPLTGGIIEPEDVARASVFLLSDDSAAITGDVLVVDGGWQFNG